MENKFKPVMADFIFALVVFALGFVFSRWVFYAWRGWGVTAFTTLYLAAASVYLMKKEMFFKSAETFFWLIITWLIGASYALWDNAGFNGWRSLFLFSGAVYYVMVASNSLIKIAQGDSPQEQSDYPTLYGDSPSCTNRKRNYIIADGFNAFVIVPLRNFINQYVSFKVLGTGGKRDKILPVLLGIIISLILVAMLVPLLRRADSGGFAVVADFFADIFDLINWDIMQYIVVAIPAAAYIYGLISGAAHKKGTDSFRQESIDKTVRAFRILPALTVYVVLGAVCALYAVFILSQLPYFFSAFTGQRPEGWLIYSEYARRGFFELCGIAVINLVVLTLSNVMMRLSPKMGLNIPESDTQNENENRGLSPCSQSPLKIFNIALAVITLILIATAFSKMALYIDAYGLTMRRLLPCVSMVFLATVFVAIIVLQKSDFSVVRFALITGFCIMCVLSFANPDALVVRYNADRYMSGTLREFDTEVLYRAWNAGLQPALDVRDKTTNEQLKQDIERYLQSLDWVERFDRDLHSEPWSAYPPGEGVNTFSFESHRVYRELG